MTDYDIVYLDTAGERNDCVITSTDTRKAIEIALEMYPDAKQIIRCYPKPMFDD